MSFQFHSENHDISISLLIIPVLKNNRMCIVLLSAGIVDWHYVNAIGYREYDSGSKYLRIVDNWNNSYNKFIYSTNLVGSYSTHIS